MRITQIASILVGIALVGGSLATVLFANYKNCIVDYMCGAMFIMGIVLTWKGVWAKD